MRAQYADASKSCNKYRQINYQLPNDVISCSMDATSRACAASSCNLPPHNQFSGGDESSMASVTIYPDIYKVSWLTDLFDLQGAWRQCPQEIGLVTRLLQPCRPVGALQHDHLAIMDWRYIRARIGRQQRKGFATRRHRTPYTDETKPILAGLREFPFRLWRLRAGKFEKMGRWHQTPTDREPSPLGTEIDDRRTLGRVGGKPHRNSENSFVPPSRRRMTGARSVGQMSSRGSRFGAAFGHRTGMRVSLKAAK